MIRVELGKEHIRVSGHAYYDELGKDVVCAAVSTLITGSAEIWQEEKGIEIRVYKNEYFMRLKEDCDKRIKFEWEFLRAHLKTVAKHYSSYISFIES